MNRVALNSQMENLEMIEITSQNSSIRMFLTMPSIQTLVLWGLTFAQSVAQPVTFTPHQITTTADEAIFHYAVDFEGDGEMDMLSATRGDDTIVWHENLIQSSPPRGDDHGNMAQSATAISVNTDVRGHIERDADVDFFQFAATAGTRYNIWTHLLTLPDSVLELYDRDGSTQIASDDDGGLGLASLIDWTCPTTGSYYVMARAYRLTQTGLYTMQVTVIPPVPPPVRVISPNGGETWTVGSEARIHWETDIPTAGTGVQFELWNGMAKIEDLGFGWDPNAGREDIITVPNVPDGSNYRVRVISTWEPTLFDISDEPFTILRAENGVSPNDWLLYQ